MATQLEVGKVYKVAQNDSITNRFIARCKSVSEVNAIMEIVAPVDVTWNVYKRIGAEVEIGLSRHYFGEL
jgi:hypothetical protein